MNNLIEEVIKEERIFINNKGDSIPITFLKIDIEDEYWFSVRVDGVEWFIVPNPMHANVLFKLMKEHLTEYMHYELLDND